MPTISQIHIDQALTNLSVMYRNQTYVGDQVLPILAVNKRSNKYFVYRKEDFLSASPAGTGGVLGSVRRPGAEAAEIDYGLSTQNYYAEEYAYRGFVADAESAVADNPLMPDMDHIKYTVSESRRTSAPFLFGVTLSTMRANSACFSDAV